MIDYELALALKNAGFPQRRGCSACLDGYTWDGDFTEEKIGDDYVSKPTLSELIEACGDSFEGLSHYPDQKKDKWEAESVNRDNMERTKHSDGDGYTYHYGHGKTPSEAVIRLWLELNKFDK